MNNRTSVTVEVTPKEVAALASLLAKVSATRKRDGKGERGGMLIAALSVEPKTLAELSQELELSIDILRVLLREMGAKVAHRGPHGIVYWRLP